VTSRSFIECQIIDAFDRVSLNTLSARFKVREIYYIKYIFFFSLKIETWTVRNYGPHFTAMYENEDNPIKCNRKL